MEGPTAIALVRVENLQDVGVGLDAAGAQEAGRLELLLAVDAHEQETLLRSNSNSIQAPRYGMIFARKSFLPRAEIFFSSSSSKMMPGERCSCD